MAWRLGLLANEELPNTQSLRDLNRMRANFSFVLPVRYLELELVQNLLDLFLMSLFHPIDRHGRSKGDHVS